MPRCNECKSEIPSDATTCPACGYSPASQGEIGRKLGFMVGCVLTMTLVLAPIGLPLMWILYRQDKMAQNRTPVNS